jgi:peptide/nickel transport system substrate-binding protein
VLESWERGVRLTLRKNPYYGGSAGPYVDRVVFDEDVKRETAFLRFRNGELDIISRVAPPDVALLRTKKWQPYMALSPRADVYAIGMNAEIPPFDNVHVRRAVAFAIDRERWVKARNYSLNPTGQMLPPSVAGYDAALPNLQRFDLARAKEEMRLAGYPDGIPEPVTMWGTESATMRAYAELLQADLKKIGISVRFKLVTFPVYLEKTATRKTAQILYLGWVMDYPDASNFLELLSSKATRDTESGNRVFYTNPWLDDQLARALVEPDPKKRVAMYREANDFVAREAPWAFFANSMAPQAWQPYVKGYRPHPAYWMPVRDVWLDLPRRRIARRTSDAGPLARAAALLPFRVLP